MTKDPALSPQAMPQLWMASTPRPQATTQSDERRHELRVFFVIEEDPLYVQSVQIFFAEYPPVGDRSRAAARRWDNGDQLVSPTLQPSSVRRAPRCACRRFRVDAALRSHEWMERGLRHGAAWTLPKLTVVRIALGERGRTAPVGRFPQC